MPFRTKRFIILTAGDTASIGYDELSMPLLARLFDTTEPDFITVTNFGILAGYLTSTRRLSAVESLVRRLEALHDSDSRFASLAIGLAEGPCHAEFDWLGRLKTTRLPLIGKTLADATTVEKTPGAYRAVLARLRDEIR